MKSYPVLLFMVVLWMGTGCGPSTNRTADTGENDTLDTATSASASAGAMDYRFEKHYRTPIQDTVHLDTMYLELHLESGWATGKYLWFIPEKDGKFGRISGAIVQDTIRGQYAYQQEGGNYTDSICIVLKGDKAIVTQYNAPQSKLIDTLIRQ